MPGYLELAEQVEQRRKRGGDPELAALVEKIGRQHQYLSSHCEEWTDEQWALRRDELLENERKMDALMCPRRERVEDYGWTFSHQGVWSRVIPTPMAK